MIDTDAPTIAERYVSAGNSSNLRCETGEDAPMGAAAIFIAAGWSQSRIGMALMRLHTKADRNGLEQVHVQIAMQAARWQIERPDAVAASVLAWWLSRICKTCHGVKFQLIPNTPALSAKQCKLCRGTGEMALPHGSDGRRMAAFMDDCKERAAQSIKNRLHSFHR